MARSNAPKFGNWETEENVAYTTYFENARRVTSNDKVEHRKRERRVNREDSESQKPVDSPLHQRQGGLSSDIPKRAARVNGGGFHSAGHSPLHPQYHAKLSAKGSNGVGSPSRERKGLYEASHGLAPSTPGRSRLRSVPRGSETPDRGASVPKFGEWDETDPASADGFTHIFNRVKEERHHGGNTPGGATDARRSNGQKHYKGSNSKSFCCFSWGRS